jgi:hypothetical protein
MYKAPEFIHLCGELIAIIPRGFDAYCASSLRTWGKQNTRTYGASFWLQKWGQFLAPNLDPYCFLVGPKRGGQFWAPKTHHFLPPIMGFISGPRALISAPFLRPLLAPQGCFFSEWVNYVTNL